MNYFDPARALAARRARCRNSRTCAAAWCSSASTATAAGSSSPTRNNIAPRIGGAFEIDDKTVLRAGYAHLYGRSYQQANGTVGPFGFRTENLWVSTVDGITPFRLLRDPYPGGIRAVAGIERRPADRRRRRDPGAAARRQPDAVDAAVERHAAARAAVARGRRRSAYVGTAGHDLQTNTEGGLSLNQLDPQYLALGSALNQTVPNPFFGIVNSGILVVADRSAAPSRCARIRSSPTSSRCRTPGRRRSITRCSSA